MNILSSLFYALVKIISVIFTRISNTNNIEDDYNSFNIQSSHDHYLHHGHYDNDNDDDEQDIFNYDPVHDDYCSYCDED